MSARNVGEALIRRFGSRVVSTWLDEFGYGSTSEGYAAALWERAGRIERELDAHDKRLADRAQMQRAPVGRAGVIR